MGNNLNFTAKQIARHRVQVLFQQATRTYKTDPKLAKTYLLAARKIAMSARMCLPPDYKSKICKKCGELLVPGESSRVRIKPTREPHVVVTCLKCGSIRRFPLKTKQKEKKEIEQDIHQDETSR
jgi:ribonuclease P protein subunit RPR2